MSESKVKIEPAVRRLEWASDWRELPRGGVIPAGGTAKCYETGSWRTNKPIWDPALCSHCLLCWIYCPDSAISIENGKMTGIAYDYCKGCGVCAHECPKAGAITMVPESGR